MSTGEMAAFDRNQVLGLDDDALARECKLDTFRGSGRGGQKRNRTESAVRTTHLATDIAVTCDETRSQHTNRHIALRKLRIEIALQYRSDCDPHFAYPTPIPNQKKPEYAIWLGKMMDALHHHQFRMADAAREFGLSTNRLIRDLAGDPQVWQAVNAARKRLSLSPLRHPG